MENKNFNEILAEALERLRRKTNADCIRAVSDEELAEFLACRASCDLCKLPCKAQEHGSLANCVAHHYDWLKEECEVRTWKPTAPPTEAELSEYWCPLSVAHPVREDQQIRPCAPGILDDTGPIRFGDIYWTEAADE